MPRTQPRIELDLLNNGIDFLLTGIDELFDDELLFMPYTVAPPERSARSYKYGMLHLYSGFILLLKERLKRHLPELIFVGKLSEIRAKEDKTKLNTIDLDEALERLEIGPRVVFSRDDIEIIRRIQTFRNRAEHYEISINPYEVWANLIHFLGIIDRFMINELGVRLEAATEDSRLLHKIKSIEAVWERVRCEQEDQWRRDIAASRERFENNADGIVAHLRRAEHENAEEYFIECPECFERTLITYGEFVGICSNQECDGEQPITRCSICGRPAIGFAYDGVWCSECEAHIREMVNRDD